MNLEYSWTLVVKIRDGKFDASKKAGGGEQR